MQRCGKYDDHNYETEYHWEDPDLNIAEFPELIDNGSDVDDNEGIVKETYGTSPRSRLKAPHSRDGVPDPSAFRSRQYSDLSQKARSNDLGSRDGTGTQQSRRNFGTVSGGGPARNSGSDIGGIGESLAHDQSIQLQLQELQEQVRRLSQERDQLQSDQASIFRQQAPSRAPQTLPGAYGDNALPQAPLTGPLTQELLQQVAAIVAQQQQQQTQHQHQPPQAFLHQTLPMISSPSQGLPELAENQPLLTAEQWSAASAVFKRQQLADQRDDNSIPRQTATTVKRSWLFGGKGEQKNSRR
jgi:hypothetical protein